MLLATELHKLAETRLRESEQRLHEIVDITNDWIWEINPAWKYSFVSPKVSSILGYQPEEMIGKSPFDFVLPEDAEKVKEGVRGMVHQFKPLNAIVNRAKHKNGQIVYLETSGIAVFTPDLSWTFSDPDAGNTQSAYQVLVSEKSFT